MNEPNQLCPEAYLSVICHFTSPPPSRKSSEPSRQDLFLTAFASCMVSSAKGEVYAVGFKPPAETSNNPATLYISGNNLVVPLATQNHAKEITTILCNISRSCDESRDKAKSSPSLDDIHTKASDLVRQLHIRTIQYSLAKIHKRTGKVTEKQWVFRKEECRTHMGSETIEAYESLIEIIDDIRFMVHLSASTAGDILLLLASLERHVEKSLVKRLLGVLEDRRDDSEHLK